MNARRGSIAVGMGWIRRTLRGVLTVLFLAHLLTAHAGHGAPIVHDPPHRIGRGPAAEHAHGHTSIDPDSAAKNASGACPIPKISAKRCDPESELAPDGGAQSSGAVTIDAAPQPSSVPALPPRPPGPDRQAILQRFTL
jgi:hypothetical protein